MLRVQINDTLRFTWEANGDEIANVMETFPRVCADMGVAPMVLAKSALKQISNAGRLLGDGDQNSEDFQMMAITWLLLNQETDNEDHPGTLGTYAENTDFDVMVETTDKGARFKVQAVSKLQSSVALDDRPNRSRVANGRAATTMTTATRSSSGPS
jgi:hypothetical protein